MNALHNGMKMEAIFESIASQTGYERQTTFASDFGIADCFGAEAVKDTYERAFNEWKHDLVYVTELVIALNWACWYHYDTGNIEMSKLYQELYYKASEWCMDNLKGDDLSYFLSVTD